jgi:hypothetical protein
MNTMERIKAMIDEPRCFLEKTITVPPLMRGVTSAIFSGYGNRFTKTGIMYSKKNVV